MNATEVIAARAGFISAAGYFDPNNEEGPPSPCVSVCRMNAQTGLCEGCFRTVDEIRQWAMADAPARRTIWARVAKRAGVTLF
ncbi:DUF1289 domain-containing protein [Ramlibacter sp. H39-3-26]|uniref:DUF1289 domain-containing protein n=1 Tax=Curvibacter soli TaxID=3031331 RepID=UPI0023DB45D8|nr:DUF1289 domain-containing protein [Ramlibacter sp. H39-3-26]MDF1484475.1 DUF1289 domain-containing protein [Ramlibacter sp. H39-3-26]